MATKKVLQRRHQYWSPEGVVWTQWYTVSVPPKVLERFELKTGRTELLCEYRYKEIEVTN